LSSMKDDEYFDEVVGLMKSDPAFDKIHTGDPEKDVDINYNKAARALLARKLATVKIKPVVHGDEHEDLATGLSGSTKVAGKLSGSIELDDFAKEYIAATGMNEDDVKAALKGSASAHLVR
jgi:hypothetical protein